MLEFLFEEKTEEELQLLRASKEGDLDMIMQLLEKGVDPNTTDRVGMTFLHFVCQGEKVGGILELLEFIIKKGHQRLLIETDENEKTALHYACSNVNLTLEVMKKMVENGTHINVNDESGKTCLHYLVESNQPKRQILEYLLSSKADASLVNKNTQTCLHLECKKEVINVEILKLLINVGNLDVDRKDNQNFTPFYYACSNSATSFEVLSFLLEKKADVNVVNLGATCLHFEWQQNLNVEKIRFLLERKADPNLSDNRRRTCLHFYVSNKLINIEGIETLLNGRADPNIRDEEGLSSFLCACANASVPLEVIKLLVENKADPNLCDFEGKTPLHFAKKQAVRTYLQSIKCVKVKDGFRGALRRYEFNILSFLIKKKADVNLKNFAEKTPLHFACLDHASYKIINLLLVKGADPNVRDKDGKTALHFACSLHLDTVYLLLEKGADPNIEDNNGKILLHYACSANKINLELIKLLIAKKVDPKSRDYFHRTCLHYACKNTRAYVPAIKFLLEKEADPNIQDRSGRTALHYAFKNKFVNIELIKLLLEKGTNPNIKDENQYTSLYYACKNENINYAKILIIFGANCEILSNFPSDTHHEILQEIEMNGTLWNPETHKLYNTSFRKKIAGFLIYCKRVSRILQQVIPKPIILHIISLSTIQ